MRPIIWGFILMVVGGIFWVMFSVIYGIIGGFTGEVPTEGWVLVYLFGALFSFSLQLQVAPEWIAIEVWTGLKRDYIREVSERKDFVLLFASDGEDTVFLGHCEIPKRL